MEAWCRHFELQKGGKMGDLQIVTGYRFDLKTADAKLSNAECYLLLTTFKYSAPRGKEKEAVSKILVISQRRGIAKQYCKGTTFVGFENYLDYLKKRARVS